VGDGRRRSCFKATPVDESAWLTCTSPDPMLEFLRDRASPRKLRLFACAAGRRIWDLLTDVRSRYLVEAAEQYADGLIRREQLATAVSRNVEILLADTSNSPARNGAQAAADVAGDAAWAAARIVVSDVRIVLREGGGSMRK
jgi:hypothetical protein